LSRKELLDTIASEIVVCTKCRLYKSRKNAVPGEGSPDSQIMFVGEGPGRNEDMEGRPFVGQAGKFLDSLISDAGLVREHTFICNVVRCRPPRNREPWPDEVEACTPYLERQIKVIQPKVIVSLGKCSTAHIFSKINLSFNSITQVHGKLYDRTILGVHVTVFPTFHPAAALYSAKYKEQLTEDFQVMKSELFKKGLVTGSS
jgi:uracil-DNA glycosylase family 4